VQALVAVSRGAAKDALVIKEVLAPKPAANEVLVRMHASGINPSDIKVRIGAQGPMVADEVIVHNDALSVSVFGFSMLIELLMVSVKVKTVLHVR